MVSKNTFRVHRCNNTDQINANVIKGAIWPAVVESILLLE